jgi:hypothetical protein
MNASAQDSTRVELYYTTIARMDKIMSKHGGSLEHLTVIYRQAEEIYKKEELLKASPTFEVLTNRYNTYVFEERVRYIEMMNRTYELEKGLVSLAIFEQEFPEKQVVKDLAVATRDKASKTLHKNLKESRTSYTIEPSLSLFTIGKPLEEFTFFQSPGVNLMYGLGAYKIFNVHESYRRGFKKSYKYSQIGLKVDYFNGEGESINQNVRLNYVNAQISYIVNRSLGIDLGYAMVMNTTLPTDKGLFSANLCAEFPMDFISLGLNARVLSDFRDVYHIQYGLSLKYIFKMGGATTPEDTKSINTAIENIDIK